MLSLNPCLPSYRARARRTIRGFCAVAYIASALLLTGGEPTTAVAAPAAAGMVAPTAASQVGFLDHTFHSNFTTKTVDMAGTERRGFQWYNWHLFGSRSDSNAVVLNSDGSVTLNGESGGAGGQLVTAVQDGIGDAFVGNSFGGGAYFEAVLKWQPLPDAARSPSNWPAFWALALEGNIAPYSNHWPGQAQGYIHGIETDFFEALPDDAGTKTYGGSMHDWYGILNVTCAPQQLCQPAMPYRTGQRTAPAGTDFTQYHRYGFLWVPATAQTRGYAQWFFDGRQIGYSYQWDLLAKQPPPPTNESWAFGVIDQQHLFIILGTGPSQPMTVQSVDVWQSGRSANVGNN